MRRRLSIENHFVKISTMMKDYGLPEKIDEEEISLERMVEAEKFINQNEHYISYKDVATGHKFFIKKDYGVKRGSSFRHAVQSDSRHRRLQLLKEIRYYYHMFLGFTELN